MSLNQEVELLRRIPLFANIEPSKLKLLAFTSERLKFREGTELFHQGDMGDSAYIIISGSVGIVVSTPNGDVKVAVIDQNDIVGEIGILCDVPRTATVVADQDVEVLKISKELFFRMVCEFPQMAVEIMRELAARLERTTSQLTKALHTH
jgi:CRP/FNR family cyclic AMP-dependent transcriptional regulator